MPINNNKRAVTRLDILICCSLAYAVPSYAQSASVEIEEVNLNSIKREPWILQQSEQLYTVQVSAFNNEITAIDFITNNKLQNDVALFRVNAGGKIWYKAIYKSFTTRKDAVVAKQKLARRIPGQAPWLRRFSDIQREIHGIMESKVTDAIGDRGVAEELQRGQSAFNQQNYTQALKVWAPLAEAGVTEAQYGLGFIYESGWGVKKDYVQAFEWYEKAATLGHAKAQYNLGLLYLHGFGVDKDPDKGYHWVQSAAKQKDRRALDFLKENQIQGGQ